jgi:hypothetical protein
VAKFAIVLLFFAAGAFNLIAKNNFSSTEIGAFYEKGSYSEYYESYIYPYEDDPAAGVFCIMEVRRESGDDYFIDAVYLPFGHIDYVEIKYHPDGEEHEMRLGDYDYSCRYELTHVATDASFTYLENSVAAGSGHFFASKISSKFHKTDCRYLTTIKISNRVYFRSAREASILGFEPCGVCDPLS